MPKIHYFDVYGRAEMSRMALHYCGVAFENVNHAGEDWAAYKPTTEFGQMPILELDDGTQLAQSQCIFNYICDKWGGEKGLTPTDPLVRYNGECTVAVLHDDFVMKHIMAAWFMPDGEEKVAKFANAIGVEWPKTAAHLGRRVPAEGFLCGATLSRYDILFASFFINMVRNKNFKNQEMAAAFWAGTPANVQAYIERVEGVFADYLAARPQNTM